MFTRLFLLDMSFATTTVEFILRPTQDRLYVPDRTEPQPVTAIAYTFVTTDLAAARTMTITLSLPDRVDNLFLYAITPNLDNNTIRIKPVMATDDSATANIDGQVGTLEHGFRCTSGTVLNHVLSGDLGAGDTQQIIILYEAEEFAVVENKGTAPMTTNRHLELGIIH